MRTADDFIGKKIKNDLSDIPVKIINRDSDKKIVYGCRIDPQNYDEGFQFHKNGAVGYEIYIICSTDGVIEEINPRVEQAKCGGHSHAPHGIPAWIIPEGSMIDLEWDSVALSCRRRMIKLLDTMTMKRRGAGQAKRS